MSTRSKPLLEAVPSPVETYQRACRGRLGGQSSIVESQKAGYLAFLLRLSHSELCFLPSWMDDHVMS